MLRREQIERLKERYPAGTVVRLGQMEGEHQMPSGMEGKVIDPLHTYGGLKRWVHISSSKCSQYRLHMSSHCLQTATNGCLQSFVPHTFFLLHAFLYLQVLCG